LFINCKLNNLLALPIKRLRYKRANFKLKARLAL